MDNVCVSGSAVVGHRGCQWWGPTFLLDFTQQRLGLDTVFHCHMLARTGGWCDIAVEEAKMVSWCNL